MSAYQYFKAHVQAGFVGIWHVQLQGPYPQKDPVLGLMLYCCCLGIFNNFEQGDPHFHFAWPENYVASSVYKKINCN